MTGPERDWASAEVFHSRGKSSTDIAESGAYHCRMEKIQIRMTETVGPEYRLVNLYPSDQSCTLYDFAPPLRTRIALKSCHCPRSPVTWHTIFRLTYLVAARLAAGQLEVTSLNSPLSPQAADFLIHSPHHTPSPAHNSSWFTATI